MKKLFYGLLFFVGFIMAVSQGETMIPNMIGLFLCGYTANKFKCLEL